MYTAVSSRPFFRRGFLWDEGFHQLLIWRWDIHISLDIIGHWLDLINNDGWIPREQILGTKALSKVTSEFVLQHPTNGNPPTLFLIWHVARRETSLLLLKGTTSQLSYSKHSLALMHGFSGLILPNQYTPLGPRGLELNTINNASDILLESLSSGFDDYPHASHPSEDERHLDLRCWMHLAADCMHSISEFLEDRDAGKAYGWTAKLLSDFELLNQMHFDHAHGAYFDYGNHSEKVRLSWRLVEKASNYPTHELVREVLEKPELKLVPHIGYVSLFPFMGRLIQPESWILEKQLDLISNKSTLWTNYGLRSLAKTSSIYMQRNTKHDPPYWRGQIWMRLATCGNSMIQRKTRGKARGHLRLDVTHSFDHGGSIYRLLRVLGKDQPPSFGA